MSLPLRTGLPRCRRVFFQSARSAVHHRESRRAGGTTGITRGAQAQPDGYTIMMGHMGTHGAAPALYPKLRYDPTKDFEPIGMAAGTPILIVARKDFPAADLKEFVARAKDTSTRISQAHAGVGSVSFTTCTLLSAQLGVKHHRVVAYRGTGPALNDLVGGQVDYMCDQIVNLVEQVRAGAIKAYAIATAERSPALRNVPTTRESGLPDYQVSAWNALFAPRGTPKEIVTKLNETLSKALDDPATRKRLLDLGSVLPQGNERSPTIDLVVGYHKANTSPILGHVLPMATYGPEGSPRSALRCSSRPPSEKAPNPTD